MSNYDWEKIVSNLTNEELAQLIKNKNSEISEKVNAAENELKKRGIDPKNKENIAEIVKPKEIIINENLPFLHTKKAVWITSFFGGPLAAGYLIYENYRNLNNQKNAKISLFLGIITTLLLFVGIFSIPDNIIDKIPNQIIPFIYTGIIYLIVKKIFGEILKKHKEDGGRFYKTGRAVIIGIVSTLIIIAGVLIYVFSSPIDDAEIEKYEMLMTDFQKNEEQALKVFSIIDSGDTTEILNQLEIGKGYWQKNILIIKEVEEYNVEEYNELLREYCKLRLKSNEMIEKNFIEKTNEYDMEIDKIFEEMNIVLDKINNY